MYMLAEVLPAISFLSFTISVLLFSILARRYAHEKLQYDNIRSFFHTKYDQTSNLKCLSFRLIRRCGVLSLFLFLFSLVTLQTESYNDSIGRCFLSAAVAGFVMYCFWARNGVVIYNVMFDRDAYLEKFNDDLRRLPSDLERYTLFAQLICISLSLTKIRTLISSSF